MSRTRRTYNDRAAPIPPTSGLDVDHPVAGFYRMKLRSGGVYAVIRIWYGPPLDPVTNEELDRSWRWQAAANGEPLDFDRAWPACARMPASEADYRNAIRRQEWARQHAPGSAYADPTRKHDPLDALLPF